MSWLARSLANSLRLDDDGDGTGDGEDDEENDVVFPNHSSGDPSPSSLQRQRQQEDDGGTEPERNEEEEEEEAQARGVKEDLSEIKQVLTRQFWGVASFLAPPPSESQPSTPSRFLPRSAPNWDRSEPLDRPDPAPEMAREIEERELEEEEEEEEEEELEECVVGITEEVLAFARNIAMHPETWLDFPLDEEDDLDDFDMSDAQLEHASAIEHLAPRLMALRIELCPCHMSEGYFWKVYFVLLHSRLNKKDAEVLSTTQVMAARAKWMQELQNQTASESEWLGSSTSYLQDDSDFLHEDHVRMSSFTFSAHSEDKALGTFPSQRTTSSFPSAFETEKHPVESSELQFIDKSVIEEKPMVKSKDKNLTVGPSSNVLLQNHEDDDDDDWPEEDFDLNEYSRTSIPVENEEDISFSDLEDDDFQAPTKFKVVSKEYETSTNSDENCARAGSTHWREN